jgi:hypothetical protein
MTTRVRQFAVKHLETGLVTLVNYREWRMADGRFRCDPTQPARLAGHRYPVDCDVTLVPMGDERPLPWGEIPMVLRRKPT